MKNLLLLVLLLGLSIQASAQEEEIIYKNTLGLDVKPAIAVLFEGEVNYIEVDYERRLKKSNFRLKLNYSDGPFNGERIASKQLDTGEDLFYESNYYARDAFILSTGLAKRFKSGKINCYYGLDANFGINFGSTISRVHDEDIFTEDIFRETNNSTTYSIGVTPVIGTKLPLTDRLSIEIELGLPIVQYLGSVDYADENGNLLTQERNFQYYRFDELLNDFRLSINF